jgi:hypothetical protein
VKAHARTTAQTSAEAKKAAVQKQAAKDFPETLNKAKCAEESEAVENEAWDDDSSDDGSSSDEDLGLCPAYSVDVPLPSIGSSGHSDGTCKRCCFFPKGRCNNGYDCQFCHFAHEKRKSKMKKKKKRRKKRQSALRDSCQSIAQSAIASATSNKNSQSQQQANISSSPSVQQHLFAGNSCWAQTPPQQQKQRPSQLIVQGLQYVPATAVPTTVMHGNQVTVTMQMLEGQCWW